MPNTQQNAQPVYRPGEQLGGTDELRFVVAPHLLQDLGVNLYGSLPSVLVEFLANAYDAESAIARVKRDEAEVDFARKVVKAEFEKEINEAKQKPEAERKAAIEAVVPLAERVLPGSVAIVIEDEGLGMSRVDLRDKFLVAGRRRRIEDDTVMTETGKRHLMGRKGVGKLAAFGVARRVEVVSRRVGDVHATKLTLDFDTILESKDVGGVKVPEERLDDGGGIAKSGTRITLSGLVYQSMSNREATLRHEIGDHFASIKPEDFGIELNGAECKATSRDYDYAYPNPQAPIDDLVEHNFKASDGEMFPIRYRIRFTKEKKSLAAKERGIRVYAHHRLAASPSLLDLKSGMHGFRNTEYLDGVVEADFIDDSKQYDYIATHRRDLRWEVGPLAELRHFLTSEMEKAIVARQKVRDAQVEDEVKKDVTTRNLLESRVMPRHRKRVALKFAKILASDYDEGVRDPEYRAQLEIFLDGLTQGDILSNLGKLAHKPRPDLHEIVQAITDLTAREQGDFMRYVEGRLKGIDALDKICRAQDFEKGDNEKELHKLLEKNPWLIRPQFNEFVVSNETESTTLEKLAENLEIGTHANGPDPKSPDEQAAFGSNVRPDLVFLLGGPKAGTIIVVELKAPNTPLHIGHLQQLKGYMDTVERWLKKEGKLGVRVEGILIGAHAPADSRAGKVKALRYDIEKEMSKSDWSVIGIFQLLEDTKQVHNDIWSVRKKFLEENGEEEVEPVSVSKVVGAEARPTPAIVPSRTPVTPIKKGRKRRGRRGRGHH